MCAPGAADCRRAAALFGGADDPAYWPASSWPETILAAALGWLALTVEVRLKSNLDAVGPAFVELARCLAGEVGKDPAAVVANRVRRQEAHLT